MQDLANSLEAALKYRAEEGNFGVSVFTGQSDYTRENPSLIVHAEQGQETPIGSGNFTVTVNLELRQTAETQDLPAFRALARDVFGQFTISDLASKLSDEGDDLHVFGIHDRQFRQAIDENQWLSVLTFSAYCCLTDIQVA